MTSVTEIPANGGEGDAGDQDGHHPICEEKERLKFVVIWEDHIMPFDPKADSQV